MTDEQLLYRKRVLFADSLTDFAKEKEEFFSRLESLCEEGNKELAQLWASDMYIDAQSFLTEWKLDRWLSVEEKNKLISRCKDFMSSDSLALADAEVKDIAACGLAQLSRETLAGRMNVYWGHDQCDEIDYSLRRGASYTTSNPGKMNGFRKAYPEQWNDLVKQAREQYGEMDAEKLLSVVTMKVVAMMARHTSPLFEATDGQYGFSSIQVSPKNWNNAQVMEDEIAFWYEGMKKELGTDTPNITFKMPATPAAVIASERINQRFARLRVCATSNFSTRQHMEFYEALKNRDPATLLVIVDVHLRTFSRPEFEAMGVDAEKYTRLLVSMVYRRCYQMLRERGLNIQINGAGIRDAIGVKDNFTTDPALPITLTIMTSVVKDFDVNPQAFTHNMDIPVSQEDMDILNRSKIFRQAYYPEEFPWDDVNSFPPYKLMMDKFEEAYDENIAALTAVLEG